MSDEERLQHLVALRKQCKPSGLTPMKGPAQGVDDDPEIGRNTNQVPGRVNPARAASSDLVDGVAGNVEHLLRWRISSRRELGHVMLIAILASGSAGLFGAVLGVVACLLVMR